VNIYWFSILALLKKNKTVWSKLKECITGGELLSSEFLGPKMENKGDILIVSSFQYMQIVIAKPKGTFVMKLRCSTWNGCPHTLIIIPTLDQEVKRTKVEC